MDNGTIVAHQLLGDNASAQLAEVCDKYHVDKAIASVVGPRPDFHAIMPKGLYSRLHILSHLSRLPITLDYETPQTLGMDRVAAVVGARVLCPDGPLLVVDAGSCITVDFLDAGNRYHGGAILPGIAMRLKAMHEYTAALPLVTLSEQEWRGDSDNPLSGKSTRASIVSGVLNASLFEIQGFADSHKRNYPDVKLFLTGGDADFFAKQLFFPNFANSDLQYIGLDKILEMNL